MPIATISSKGQLTLPAGLRKQHGIKPKDRLLIESSGDTIVIRRPVDFLSLKGILGKRKMTLRQIREKMMKGVADHVNGRDADE